MTVLEKTIEIALDDGYISPALELGILRTCLATPEISSQTYQALERLTISLITGEVEVIGSKHFVNIIERLVIHETKQQLTQQKIHSGVDIGDIVCYTLNRLPALYATSEQGVSYQKVKAQYELTQKIKTEVHNAIEKIRQKPQSAHNRKTIPTKTGGLLDQVNQLLKKHAHQFDQTDKAA